MGANTDQLCGWVEKPGPDADVVLRHVEVPRPGAGEVLVKLEVSGVCHSDCHSIYGNTPMTTHVAGHEGVGRVVQEYVVAPAKYVTRIPEGIKSELVAPLLCGGITMYGALTKARLRPGDYVIIPGAGGGLGHLGIQIARHLGYQVIALDSGEEKRALCTKLGANYFLDFATDSIPDRVHDITKIGAHAIVCAAGSAAAYDTAIPLLRHCGTLICVGIPPSSYRMSINPFELIVKGIVIVGTSVGNRQQMEELLNLAAEGKVVPHVEVLGFEEINVLLKRLNKFEVVGRAAVKIPQ